MYAQQAIKDLLKDSRLTQLGNDILHLIRSATKYHFGDILKDVFEVMAPMVKKFENETGEKFKVFKSQMEGVVSPFDTVWFDWIVKGETYSDKHGCLIIKNTSPTNPKFDLLSMYLFITDKFGGGGKWRLWPVIVTIDMCTQVVSAEQLTFDNIVDDLTHVPDQQYRDLTTYILSAIHMALLLLNCRNVELHKRFPDEKLQKKRKKYGKLPMFSYHVLEIKDVRKKDIYPEDHTPTEMGKLRYHQMPARVVYYSAEKPLFGNPKLTGWYAFKSYWRGDKKKGTVIRDYERKEGTTQNLVHH